MHRSPVRLGEPMEGIRKGHTMYYAIHAVRNVETSDGWTATRQLPTFFLHDVPQGITSAKGAEDIARHLLESASEGIPGKVTFNVTAFPTDSHIR